MTVAVEEHYQLHELADRLHISQSTVRRYVDLGARTKGSQGIYPTLKVSRRVILVPASSVQRFLSKLQR